MSERRGVFEDLPQSGLEFAGWGWGQIAPYFKQLANRPLDGDADVDLWLRDWTRLTQLVDDAFTRLQVAYTQDTRVEAAEKRYHAYLEEIVPPARAAAQKLKEKLLAGGWKPAGMEVALRNIQAEAALFREANLPLFTEERKLASEYEKIIGAQTVQWEGKETTVVQLQAVMLDANRKRREKAWRVGADRQLADREKINDVWRRLMAVRRQIARNADCADYREYRWRQLLRFDYSPADCQTFHAAIASTAAKAATKLYDKRARLLGVEACRPWDLLVDPKNRPPLKPFDQIAELEEKAAAIFRRVDPRLGDFFQTMRDEKLLDLANRPGKAPGGYCTTFAAAGRPFIFMNAVGIHDDVQTVLHEAGHSFHVFLSRHLPYEQQRDVPMEFAEVASMAMELLAAPYLASPDGFYSEAEAARARAEHLERSLQFWPYMAVVDAFQHWVYTHHDEASDPDNCDAKWLALWRRFMPDVDYDGFEDAEATGWQRKLHIHCYPFYYVEYGLAQLGAALVWRKALDDQTKAVNAYRKALGLGGTVPLPKLFRTAGAKFAFDAVTLRDAVDLMMGAIEELDAG
jgi:oligoendopeptidase F